jgi:KDO2-lipid IV(A) lauroyltransferase
MQLLVYILAYPFLWVISRLPFKLFYFFSDVVFVLVYHIVGYRKGIVLENLQLAFPEKERAELLRIRRDFYHHFCDMFLEMVKTMSLSKEEVKKRFHLVNMELLREIEANKTVLVLCAHYANWEWNVSINNYIKTMGYAVYQKIGNKYFDRMIRKIRSRWNTMPIQQKDTVKTILRNEQNGIRGVFGMVSDQSPQVSRAQYWSHFMGVKVPIFNGAEVIARKLDLSVVFLKVTKVKRGHYQAEFVPIALSAKNTEPNQITEAFLRETEKQIRQEPAHYLWTHRRWKHRDKVPAKFA